MTQRISQIGAVTSGNTEPDTRLRAAVSGFTDDQVTRALALIAANNIAKVPGLAATYVAVSSDGVGRYMVDRYSCQCAAGRKRTPLLPPGSVPAARSRRA